MRVCACVCGCTREAPIACINAQSARRNTTTRFAFIDPPNPARCGQLYPSISILSTKHDALSLQNKNVRFVQSRNVRFHGWPRPRGDNHVAQRERDQLKVLHEVKQKHLSQVAAAARLKVSDRQVRRMLLRIHERRDAALVHGLR
jgi:hypothetical protein